MDSGLFESELVTLDTIIGDDLFFNIPIYQRLYVWRREQVETLLNDLWEAYQMGQEVYYLGGTLVIERPWGGSQGRMFDLIDGQQRFTTLWLMAICMGGELQPYRSMHLDGEMRHRISFAIRPKVKEFFDAEMAGRALKQDETTVLEERLADMRAFLEERRDENGDLNLSGFTHFIRHNVQLVLTRVPAATDLNKLFELINNRGQQLQHHEILKASLLACINDEEREVYSQLWDACSYMNDYVERNLRRATGIKLVELFDNKNAGQDEEGLWYSNKVVRKLKRKLKGLQHEELTLSKILRGAELEEQPGSASDVEDDYLADRVRSIVTFSMFLQHVLRIFLHSREGGGRDIPRVLDRDLIAIFNDVWPKKRSEEDVKYFIELLWELRYGFDKYVIKWVETDEGEVHAIRNLRVTSSGGNSYLVRDNKDSSASLALLQSMLYHSQQLTTHYWLTPLLAYLNENGGKSAETYLRYLDNHLLCSQDDAPLVQRSWRFVKQHWHSEGELDVTDILQEKSGTGFSHYWFYKLEYILWCQLKDSKGKAWQSFRMRARNSVEHISPQHPRKVDSNKLSKSRLDTFGNLGLVSSSINSEYSNKTYLEKRSLFLENNRKQADSLKMALIFENKSWNDVLAKDHQDDMIERYRCYFEQVEKDARRAKY